MIILLEETPKTVGDVKKSVLQLQFATADLNNLPTSEKPFSPANFATPVTYNPAPFSTAVNIDTGDAYYLASNCTTWTKLQ